MQTFMERNTELRELIAQSGVTEETLRGFTKSVLSIYQDFAEGLPDDSAWKHDKLAHVTHGAGAVRKCAGDFGLDGVEIDVVAFPLMAHDTGRLIHEHIQRGSKRMPPWRHGIESALFAEGALGKFAKTPLGKVLLLAIKHHSDITTPSVEDLGGSVAAHALVGLVRDFDKMAGFDDASQYTGDPDFKRKQILTNFSTQRKDYPTLGWGEEKNRVLPDSHFEDFITGHALERRKCESYEAYMAQYLAWTFDIQNEEVLQLCVAKGGPKIVLAYLLSQLRVGQNHDQYERLEKWASTWNGGLLFR